MNGAIANNTDPTDCATEKLVSGGVFEFGPGEAIFEGTKHSVYVSAFFIKKMQVSLAEWNLVSNWAAVHDYEFSNEGNAHSDRDPVRNINWYDALKWCNAKSEMEELLPCYRVSGIVYRKGEEDGVTCDWIAKGYRLPTKAEWEKAANGSHLGGVRFNNRPSGERFNEWCWDRVNPLYKQGVYDPKGPDEGEYRVLRGGLTIFSCGNRHHDDSSSSPEHIDDKCGFRLVRSLDRMPLILAFVKRVHFNVIKLRTASATVANLWRALW